MLDPAPSPGKGLGGGRAVYPHVFPGRSLQGQACRRWSNPRRLDVDEAPALGQLPNLNAGSDGKGLQGRPL